MANPGLNLELAETVGFEYEPYVLVSWTIGRKRWALDSCLLRLQSYAEVNRRPSSAIEARGVVHVEANRRPSSAIEARGGFAKIGWNCLHICLSSHDNEPLATENLKPTVSYYVCMQACTHERMYTMYARVCTCTYNTDVCMVFIAVYMRLCYILIRTTQQIRPPLHT